MTEAPGTDGDRGPDDEALDRLVEDPEVRAWFVEHLPELRRSAFGNRLLYQALALGFVLGLAAHIGGYALRASSPGEPLALVADLVYALGWALWTGCVVAVFVQVIPEVKRRQFRQAMRAFEASTGADGERGVARGDDGEGGGSVGGGGFEPP